MFTIDNVKDSDLKNVSIVDIKKAIILGLIRKIHN